ncbi:hypothetical protein LWC34_38795 [Kibdelosporangium philippinense]|uniref:DUF4352 domain-containing protein n=2 Tax=Kibdelosporangium philippinense TaxID=211113 RepID=A0ABS8ZQH2_9PSEU|nr:hypothetical protein [Kibdelosporangium philippinense]MCE7008718.1 hypothetical protein [Kibdelosporangium philippinense]
MRHLIAICAIPLLVAACTAPKVNTGAVSDASSGAQAPVAEQKPTPTWGQRHTWPNGLAVEIAKPTDCKPGKYAQPEGAKRGIKVKVTVTNGTDAPFETSVLTGMDEVQFAGANAELLFDSSGPCKAGIGLETATVLPGKTYSYEVAYAVGAEPGELQITLQPAFGQDKAVFVGQA